MSWPQRCDAQAGAGRPDPTAAAGVTHRLAPLGCRLGWGAARCVPCGLGSGSVAAEQTFRQVVVIITRSEKLSGRYIHLVRENAI